MGGMCCAGGEEHPTSQWSSCLVTVVDAERDITRVSPEKRNGGKRTIPFMNSLLNQILRTLVAGQGLLNDAMEFKGQHIRIRPPSAARPGQL